MSCVDVPIVPFGSIKIVLAGKNVSVAWLLTGVNPLDSVIHNSPGSKTDYEPTVDPAICVEAEALMML